MVRKTKKEKSEPGWIGFDERAWRLYCSSCKTFKGLEEGTSRREMESIHENEYWNISIEEVIELISKQLSKKKDDGDMH